MSKRHDSSSTPTRRRLGRSGWAALIVLAALGGVRPARAAEVVASPSPAASSCDAVCQLRAQDWAFALLVETYREYRSNQIEKHYDRRLQMVATLGRTPDDTMAIEAQLQFLAQLREIFGDLAVTERTRGLQLVHTQVANLQTVYDCARKQDEQSLGLRVEKNVNPRQAARELKQYVATKSDLLGSRPPVTQPAAAVLLDRPAVPADPNLLAETCE
jgi:hypothetical protein